MFEIELKNPEEISIKVKEKAINVNVAQSTISAGLAVGAIKGAGEFEIGDATITGVAIDGGSVIYRIEVGNIAIGVVGKGVKAEALDELGPIDVLGACDSSVVGIIEPKIVIPMEGMDFSELKATVKVEKKLKIKNESSLPVAMEIYKLD